MNFKDPTLLQNCFFGKTVLITGHTGFKGAWLTAWLKKLGANIYGLSLDPSTDPSHFTAANLGNGVRDLRVNILDRIELERVALSAKPDFVFHLAAQALVHSAYVDPVLTWQTNVIGTLNLLEALRKLENRCSAVIITSDKCYDNLEWVWGYRETDAMGGIDPYSASKGAAELLIHSHILSFFSGGSSNVRIASARAGNVIGGGDWSPYRIIPDCVKAWAKDCVVELRNPHATRPWQHVLEPLSGYLNLAMELTSRSELHGESFNFGPQARQNHTVLELVEEMSLHWDQVLWKDVSSLIQGPHESGLLKLNCDKALHDLRWYAVMDFKETVRATAEWYESYYKNSTVISSVTDAQIDRYVELARTSGLSWAK